MQVNLTDKSTGQIIKVLDIQKPSHCLLEISPSAMTSNKDVKWLISEFSRLYQPFVDRISIKEGKLCISPENNIWWEVFIFKGQIRFHLIVPDKEEIKHPLKNRIMKTWKRASIREVKDYMPNFDPDTTEVTTLKYKYHSILSLDTTNPQYSPLDSILHAKHYLKDDDVALLQIGMSPLGTEWNKSARELIASIKKDSRVPRKKGKEVTKGEIVTKILRAIGLIAEELINFMGDFLIPGWTEDTTFKDIGKNENGEISLSNKSTMLKSRSDAFKTEIRIIAQSENAERRKSMVRAMSSGFDLLEGDNSLEEITINGKKKQKMLGKVMERKMSVKINGDAFCSLELAKMIQVPDQKAQIENYNELNLVQHRGETDVPKEIFVEDEGSIPFAVYEDTDGTPKTAYFSGSNHNLLCMPRVVIGEPGTGKTTFAQNYALSAFNNGYGVFIIDAADGKMIQRILDRVRPDQRDKVKVVDFLNTDLPIGLGWNEIFNGTNLDIIEDTVVEEVVNYIELVSNSELNMRARQWVENAIKAVFITPDATLQDVENMLNDDEYRGMIIPTIEDPMLRADWIRYHVQYKKEERQTIYNEAFRRLAPVMRKKTLRNFVLQRPKKDEEGNYVFDIRKWMDEGYLVLVRATEILGESLQTALISFLISKFNLAMISRENVINENDRKPCFLILDEPDHYIKGSERWRNMLTRYRKYRCGLVFMFHGWQQLKEADRDLPKIIRKSGPHYVIFQTDEDNLLELKPVVEPEFKIAQLVKGMPQHHAVIKLKMYGKNGEAVPAFMAKSLGKTEDLFPAHKNDDLYLKCSEELGKPKHIVMAETSSFGDLDIVGDEEEVVVTNTEEEIDEEHEKYVKRKIEFEVDKFIEGQISRGEEPDYDLVIEMDRILEGDDEDVR